VVCLFFSDFCKVFVVPGLEGFPLFLSIPDSCIFLLFFSDWESTPPLMSPPFPPPHASLPVTAALPVPPFPHDFEASFGHTPGLQLPPPLFFPLIAVLLSFFFFPYFSLLWRQVGV